MDNQQFGFRVGLGLLAGSFLFMFLLRCIFGFSFEVVGCFYYIYATMGSLLATVGMVFLVINAPPIPFKVTIGKE